MKRFKKDFIFHSCEESLPTYSGNYLTIFRFNENGVDDKYRVLNYHAGRKSWGDDNLMESSCHFWASI